MNYSELFGKIQSTFGWDSAQSEWHHDYVLDRIGEMMDDDTYYEGCQLFSSWEAFLAYCHR